MKSIILLVIVTIFLVGFSITAPNIPKPTNERYCRNLLDLNELVLNEYIAYDLKVKSCSYSLRVCHVYVKNRQEWLMVFRNLRKEIFQNCPET